MTKHNTSYWREQITEFVARKNYKPLRVGQLAKKLNLSKSSFLEFEEIVDELIHEGKLKRRNSGRIEPTVPKATSPGILRRVSSGNGYVTLHDSKSSDREQDIFIQKYDLADGQSGDEVLVQLLSRRRSGGQRCGKIVKVINRSTTRFVGSYFEEESQAYVFVEGNDFEEAIWIGDTGAHTIAEEDMVVIEMLKFPSKSSVGEAVLVEVLGQRGEAGVDTQTIINEFGLPTEFSQDALDQARQQAATFDETDFQDRLDLTLDTIITIDPKEARDFDDAISLTQTDDGHWHLGVHIADVSHFVQPNTPLDVEALKRGTSVYLPTKVIPMLPEILSNGLASLQQDRVRFVKSVFIEFTEQGIPVDTRFSNSVIKVKQRFAYQQVMQFFENPEKVALEMELDEKIPALLFGMQKLGRILRKRRFENGALELNMPETRLKFNKQGKVSGAFVSENDESHQIIEEFMLAANIAVATGLTARGVRYLRRTHGEPAADKAKLFHDFVESLGLVLPKNQSRFDLQQVLNETAGTPLERSVHYALLRSLKQAEYTPEEEGHFALAVEDYCHFTSPIRRYPDLTVHRIVDRLLIRGEKYKGESDEKIYQIATHCNDMSRRAERAERDLTKLKLLEYMEQRIGEQFDGIITGVERFGIFCQAAKIPAEGIVLIAELEKIDRFDFERESHCLIGRRTGIRLQLGAKVRIKVDHVDLSRRLLNYTLEKVYKPEAFRKLKTAKAKKATKKRTPSISSAPKASKTKSKSKSKPAKKRKPKRGFR